MDEDVRLTLKALVDGHDQMAVRQAALTAVLGAVTEVLDLDLGRVDAWCRAIAQESHETDGVSQTAVQRQARDLLKGVREPKAE